MKLQSIVQVGAGSGLGAVARYLLQQLLAVAGLSLFPLATLLANLLGCLLIGLLAGRWAGVHANSRDAGRWHFWITGVCGGFTTFSTFSSEVLTMMLEGRGSLAGLYAGVSLGLGIFATWAGLSYSLARKSHVEESADELG
jgi:CrcB protein